MTFLPWAASLPSRPLAKPSGVAQIVEPLDTNAARLFFRAQQQ